MSNEFTQAQLEALIRRHRPRAGEDLLFQPIRTGKFNSSYIVTEGAERLVLRIAPPGDAVFVFYERAMMRQEPGIHELLLTRTSVPVPRILAFDDSHELIDRDYMLMEYLPGRPLTEAPEVEEATVLRQVGAMLAEVHALTAERYGYLGAHQPLAPGDTWVEAFGSMWRALIADVAAVGHYRASECEMLEHLFETHAVHFDRPVPACLLHMDVWHQNIMVDDGGKVTGLIDWDRALWGDPEIEFAVLDYCGVSTRAFWEGYGRARDTSLPARIRQLFYLLYEMQKYIVIRHGRSRDPGAARAFKRQCLGLAKRLNA